MTRTHMQARRILIGLGALFIGAASYAFRPDRLFVDRTVDEPLLAPGAGDREAELVGRGLVPAPTFTALKRGRGRMRLALEVQEAAKAVRFA